VTGVVNGCRWCRAKTFFSQNELLLEPKELGYTHYTLVRLWSVLVARSYKVVRNRRMRQA
jgi:hypothetical protein